MKMIEIKNWLETTLTHAGIDSTYLPWLLFIIYLTAVVLMALITYMITKKFVISLLNSFFKKTTVVWDDILAERRTFDNLAHIIPALLVRFATPILFSDYVFLLPIVLKGADIYIIIASTLIVISFLKAIEFVAIQSPAFANKPIASYFQLLRLVIYIALFIIILSIVIGKSPLFFLSAFGAMTAILLLIFKDTILGLVASVQISSNDIVRVGDWVEMPKFNADGDVIAINLNTVKVRNWDKTITAVPTYYFISESFKNWRGMQESGGRRIKRAIYLNVNSIRFVDPEMRERLKKFELIREFVEQRQQEIEEYNRTHDVDTSILINGRRMTNIGVFRKYVENYLHSRSSIRKDMTILVRQLPGEDRGLPIEVYCFTNTTAWIEYESIQSDIFDHLLSAASWFGLEVYQQPAGSDISKAIKEFTAK
jgi:miniconductance mechanosensitive channel